MWRQWSSRLTCDKLASRQPVKGHMRMTWWNLNNLLLGYISQVTSQLGQLASDPWNSLPRCFKGCLSSFLYTHYISLHYPRNCKETFKDKTLTIHLRFRECKPTIMYTISLSFPLLLPLQLQILGRFLPPNTYLTQSGC